MQGVFLRIFILCILAVLSVGCDSGVSPKKTKVPTAEDQSSQGDQQQDQNDMGQTDSGQDGREDTDSGPKFPVHPPPPGDDGNGGSNPPPPGADGGDTAQGEEGDDPCVAILQDTTDTNEMRVSQSYYLMLGREYDERV